MSRQLIRYLISAFLVFTVIACSKRILITTTKPVKTTPPTAKRNKKTLPSTPRPAKGPLPFARIVITYQSTGNDMANILIRLRDNKTFEFQMAFMPETAAQKEDQVTMRGTWKQELNRTLLHFDRKDIDLNALFDKNYASAGEFEILDSQSVAINGLANVIHIWGIACEKK